MGRSSWPGEEEEGVTGEMGKGRTGSPRRSFLFRLFPFSSFAPFVVGQTLRMTLTPHASKRLIVNGDDFGLSPQVNAGILYAHRHGILTNTSLMVTAPAWEEAVALAQATPSLSVGLH